MEVVAENASMVRPVARRQRNETLPHGDGTLARQRIETLGDAGWHDREHKATCKGLNVLSRVAWPSASHGISLMRR
jgi:hypothetical protein